MTVAEKIKLYLVEHKIKQSVVSDETGINKDKLCLSLNGKRKLSSDEFSRIVSFLGVSADLFIVPKKNTEVTPNDLFQIKKKGATMTNLIKVTYENERPTVMGRELHEFLESNTQYTKWFDRMKEYGFYENVDYLAISQKRLTAQGNETTYTDHQLTIEMAKRNFHVTA